MPSTEKKQKSELISVIDSFLDERVGKKDEDNVEFLSITDFIERFKLLPNGLFPVQKFILKLYYNIPLDDTEKVIKITDRFNTKVLHEFTEVQYLVYLYDQGRCNIRVQDSRTRHELILVLGRRSGKSTLSAIIAAYELYKLLRRRNPQGFYGIPVNSEIRVLCVANDKEQASIVYGDMSGYVDNVDYFKSSMTNQTQTFMRFQTDQDRQKYGQGGRSTITATFKSSIAKGLRGRGIICYILDEIAFFVDDGKSSAEQVYRAINPSIAQFSPKDPKNKHKSIGPSDGRAIMISSPDARDGFFYRQYQTSSSGGIASKNMLMVQAPTWEVNPTLDSSYYEVEFNKDPKSFMTEHGAEFSDRVRGWIEESRDLTECIKPGLRPIIRGGPRELFWAGVDFGIVRDGTSIAIVHFIDGKIELAYHEVWYAGKSWYDSNPHLTVPPTEYAKNLKGVTRLDMIEIAEWFKNLSTRFYIEKGVFDQWAGPIFEQELHRRGLKQFEMRNFSITDSSHAFHTTKMCMFGRQLSLYDYPTPQQVESDSTTMRHSPLIAELLELQATSGGKNITVVEAPKSAGKHDDQSDALVRSVLLATEYIKSHPGVLETSVRHIISPVQQAPVPSSYNRYHSIRHRMHGGPDRMRIGPTRR
jgi:hypothetical protein